MSGHFYSPICCIKILRHIKQANFELFVVNRCWFQIYSGLFCDQPGRLTSKAEHNVLIFSDLWRETFFLPSNARHKKVFFQHFLMLSFDALIFHAILCDSCWLETIRKQSSLYFSSIKLSKSCSVISVLLGDSVGYVELLIPWGKNG